MKLGAVSGARYTGELARREQEKKAASTEEKRSGSIALDYIKISQEAREKVQARPAFDSDWVREQIKSANEQAEAKGKELKTMSACLKIAARIMAGDKVTPEDLKYLMEHDSKGYQLAMAMRRQKPDPEKCKRISEDEEEKGTAQVESGGDSGGETASVEGSPAPEAPAAVE